MSLVDQIALAPDEEVDPSLIGDPFRLGYRYARRTLADGTEEIYPIPLTLEDLLFPEEEDHPLQMREHVEDCVYLYSVLKARTAAVPKSLVTMDFRVDFEVPDVRPLGPDIAAFFNVEDLDKVENTLKVGETNAETALVVEVTSPDGRQLDLQIKQDFYHRAEVACYVIIDSRFRSGVRKQAWLVGYRYTPERYEPIPLDDQGRLWVEPLNLWLQIVDRQVRCIDGPTGQTIEPYLGQVQARLAAEAQIQTAIEARQAAEAQTQTEIEARLAAEAQAQAAEARAQAELEARRELEAQMAALQAELQRLRGDA